MRRLALDSVPELAAMVDAMRGTLSGDGTALQRYFSPGRRARAARWTLTLVPLDYRLLGVVRQLRIDGRAPMCAWSNCSSPTATAR